MKRVMAIFGTRPEAIKIAPVLLELQRQPEHFETVIVVTAQHRRMLDQMLDMFGLQPDFDLDVMQPDQHLSDLTSRVLARLQAVFDEVRPDLVFVQGDTTTTFCGALIAFYNRVPVGHIEAGLRSGNKQEPFPEEINRRLCDTLSDYLFAPTISAREALLREGIPPERVHVTGNTVIDALFYILSQSPPQIHAEDGRLILVTAHRRENHGPPLRSICTALQVLVKRYPDVRVLFPVHLSPNVRTIASRMLCSTDRIVLCEPLDYVTFVQTMQRAYLILTDSGGVQEEASSLGCPVLVLRNVTERPEVIEAGVARLVGTRTEDIVAAASELLEDPTTYQKMARAINLFGDGRAAVRIVEIITSVSIPSRPTAEHDIIQ